MRHFEAWVDGGARGNPGPAGYGVLLTDERGAELLRAWGFVGHTTNNVAEYRGMIAALERAVELGAESLVVRTDSELIERQLKGVYKIKQPHLKELAATVRKLAARLDRFEVIHVRRAQNKEADALANRAMDERADGCESSSDSRVARDDES